ncbi:OmpA family protein [Pollutimonas sp. M17]|uniref:OmpA family protein n=1 Tax=Pollutimonas sp. M17 TaxID=2962065 RepID=UPI0021F42E40|nr:OmpA family protein [Pollutimonas sp. M17]UYO93230.1 OmpA family protein [Pollutimonas sp. M17]
MNPAIHNKWYVEPEPQEETESWLLTYLDMITLLLVLLVAMLTLSGQVPKHPPLPATAGLLPAHSGLLPGQAELAAAPEALPPGALPAPPLAPPSGPVSAVPPTSPSGSTEASSAARMETRPAVDPDAPPARAQPSTSPDDPAAGIFLSDAPDYVLGEADPEAILEHVMASPDDPQAPASTSPLYPAAEAEPPTLAAPVLPELGDDIEIIRNKESISFRINSEILYSSAKADLSLEGLAVMRRLVPVFKDSAYAITVEGHTDSVPVRGGRYASNWELSGARAGSVVRYLEANGIDSSRLRAIGYADTRPLAGNDSEQGRAANRRVELILDQPSNPD